MIRLLASAVVLWSLVVSAPALDCTISDDAVVLGDAVLTLPLKMADLIQVIGKPDRSTRLANVIHTWEQHGMTAYDDGQGGIKELCIQLVKEPYPFSPKVKFQGTVRAFGMLIQNQTTKEQLVLAGFTQENVFEAFNFRRTRPRVSVNVDTVNNRMGWTRVSVYSAK
jgi:hypothetical protein